MVCVAGFEPAAPAVQVRYYDQTELHTDDWCRQQELNPRHPRYKGGALPTELRRRNGGACRNRTDRQQSCKDYPLTQSTSQLNDGGRLRNRTPDLAVLSVFKTDCQPFSGAFHYWRMVLDSNQRNLSAVLFSKQLRYHCANHPEIKSGWERALPVER